MLSTRLASVGRSLVVAAVAAAFAMTACIGSETTPCGDAVCPKGSVCYRDQGPLRCAQSRQIRACEGLGHGDPCEVTPGERGWFCDEGICNPAFCGDGLVQAGEDCDDGNAVAGDGCGPSCLFEECGNLHLDPGEECDAGPANSDTAPDTCYRR